MRTALGVGQRSRLFTILLWVALLAAVITEIASIRTSRILSQTIWTPEGLERFLWYGLIFTGLSALLLFQRRYFIPLALGTVVLGTLVAVGPAAPGAVLLFVFSATVLGKIVFGRELEGPVAFLGGTAIWILAMTCLVRVPIHYQATYVIVLALPVAIGYQTSRRLANGWLRLFRPTWTPSLPEFGSVFLVAFVAIAHWLVVLKPEVSFDGLAMHLATASNIAIHHAFTIDFRQFVWALMPMGADWCYSVVYVLGGEYAARLLNFAFLAVIGLLLFGVARRWVSDAVATFMVFLFLSTPMVQLVTGSLLVENCVAAMGLGAAVALWKFQEESRARWLMLTAFLLGTSVALKLGELAVAAVMAPFLAAAMWRNRQRLSKTVQMCALVILMTTASAPYVNAYWRSGNPIFPFENAKFHSPYFVNENIVDGRYQQRITWLMPLKLTFRTTRYYEAQNGSFGLQYFLFLPLMLVCLVSLRSFAGRAALVIGLVGVSIIAVALPNARYFYPFLPFLTLGATAALAWLAVNHRSIFRASLVAALLAGLLNTYLLPASGWYQKDFFSAPLFSERGRRSYLLWLAPVRELIAYINRVDRFSPVVFLDTSTIAGLIPPAYANNWHDNQFREQVEAIQDPEDLYRLFTQLGVHRLIVDPNSARGVIKSFLEACAQQEYSVSSIAVMLLQPHCEIKLPAVEPLTAGVYDETDPRITFLGVWTQMKDLPSAYQHTLAFTNQPGAKVRFQLMGRAFRYTYTREVNRGIAEIIVDGTPKAVLDLYSHDGAWQSKVTIADLSPGLHEVAIRATGKQNPAATGHFVDIDAIEVLSK